MHTDKQPAEIVRVWFDFGPDLGSATIDTVDSVVIAPTGTLAEVAGSRSNTDTLVTFKLEGGTDGADYAIEVTITDSDGQVLQLPGAVQVIALPAADAAANTPAGLKAMFPAFAAVPNATIQMWLTVAAETVDDSWLASSRARAQALLAAHEMVTNGIGTGAEAEAAANGASGFRVMKSGGLTLERFDTASGASAGAYAGTSYGRQFAVLLRQNRGGPLITGTGTLPGGGYPGRW